MDTLFKQKKFKIIHIDMDYFYAQVEMRDDPSLLGRPVGIGGPSRTQGILCTSNYEARKYGVRAALSTYEAFRLCPDLVLIPPRFPKYIEISNTINEIFLRYSDKVQKVSLDEAYIDVTASTACAGSATRIALAIREEILERTGLTASAGVSFNKLLAKIASDWNKPDGAFVITPDMRLDFMRTLSLKKIPGVGSVRYAKFEKLGLKTCGDVSARTLFELSAMFGKRYALDLSEACQGICNDMVTSKSPRKSFGIEKTFFDAISRQAQVDAEIEELLDRYDERLRVLDPFHFDGREISHLSIKVRFSSFDTYTREVPVAADHSALLIASRNLDDEAREKIRQLFRLMNPDYRQALRLIGLGVKLRERSHQQMDFGWQD